MDATTHRIVISRAIFCPDYANTCSHIDVWIFALEQRYSILFLEKSKIVHIDEIIRNIYYLSAATRNLEIVSIFNADCI